MKRTFLVAFALASTTAMVSAQQAGGEKRAMELVAQAGGTARVALETRVTRGAPYTGEAVTEFVQSFADGNRIVRRTTTRLYRDGEGRTRRELLSEVPSNGGEMANIVITDPVAGTSLILDPSNRTAQRMPATFARVSGGSITVPSGSAAVPVVRAGENGEIRAIMPVDAERRAAESQLRVAITERAAASTTALTVAPSRAPVGQSTKEDLGEQVIEGVRATGTRTTTVIPAGAIGNEQPLTTVSEQWYSPELQVLLLTKHSDPRVGETTYRLTNIVRSEPDRGLFQAPSDYTVKEPTVLMRRPPQ